MPSSRGEDSFARLPRSAAKLYDSLMRGTATRQQVQEIGRDLVSRLDRGRLLDVGTGPGYLLLEIHKLNPAIELHGLDVSAAMADQARRNLQGVKADLRLGSISATEYPSDYFDLVTCTGSLYLWDRPVEALEEIHRILKTGGAGFLYETHRDADREQLRLRMRQNLKGENLPRRVLAPRFFAKQLGMTYNRREIVELLSRSSFASSYRIDERTIANLPVWLRIKVLKRV